MPNIQPFQDFTQGDGFNIKISHNPVISLVGYSFEVTLRACEDSPDPVMSVIYAIPVTEPEATNAAAGIAYIPIATTDTVNVQPGKYWASVKRIDVAGTPNTLIRTGKAGADMVECFKNLKG